MQQSDCRDVVRNFDHRAQQVFDRECPIVVDVQVPNRAEILGVVFLGDGHSLVVGQVPFEDLPFHFVEDSQLEEVRQAEAQAKVREAESARLLAEIENQLVPRRNFLVLESQVRRTTLELRQVKQELRQQSRQLRRIERGVARLTGSG